MDKQLAEKAKEAKSVEDLSRMAKEQGISLSDSQAEEICAQHHAKERSLSDEELNIVDGGRSSLEDLKKQYQRVEPTSVCGEFV
jgi:predicted ribosomally synthesized peptide with nif11-like leader